MASRTIVFAIIATVLPVVAASAQTRNLDSEEYSSIRDLLQKKASAKTLAILGTAESDAVCKDSVEGQFIFCINVPGAKMIEETESREEWTTCLVYNEETCCHEFKKVLTKVPHTVMKPVSAMKEFCVKLSVPIDYLLTLPACDCDHLPGTGLPSLLSKSPQDVRSGSLLSFAPSEAHVKGNRVPVRNVALGIDQGTSSPNATVETLPSPARSGSATLRTSVADDFDSLPLVEQPARDASTLNLKNAFSFSVEIDQFKFEPKARFQRARNVREGDTSFPGSSSKPTAVILGESSRTQATLNETSSYLVQIGKPIEIVAGGVHRFTLGISNSDRSGWGLIGKLTVKSTNGEELIMPDFQVEYVSDFSS